MCRLITLHCLHCKSASKKIGALIRSMKFLSPDVTLYLNKSIIQPCMEYCSHVWAGAPSCYLELLDKLQKWICRTVGLSFAGSLEPFVYGRSIVSLSFSYWYYFGKCSSELAKLVPLPYSRGRPACYSDRLHYFSVTISISTVSFLAQLDFGILCLQNAFL